MSLYDRNFNELNDFEKEFLEKESKNIGKTQALKDIPLVPKGIKHYKSLFPNNFLDPDDTAEPILSKFISKLNESNTTERTILNFVKENKGYFLIGSLMNSYRIGSQNAFIFPEFRLGNSYQVDYLLLGKNSGGYEFIFVELEDPYKEITLQDGNYGNAIRKGINQINIWKGWLQANFTSLNETFEKYKHPDLSLPEEFYKFDNTRMHYIVVSGRRKHFNKLTRFLVRSSKQESNIAIFHYDNIYDFGKKMLKRTEF